jgi:hypothetical protein
VLAGVTDPSVLSWLGTIPTTLFSTLGIFLVYRLALAWRWPSETALAAAFLYAVHWLPFGYGATLFPRPISTAFLLGAFLLGSRAPLGLWRASMAGVLVAAAFATRWSEAAALLPLAAWTWWRERNGRAAAAVVGGFLLGALLFVGVTDALTWGAPFSSLKEYVREMSAASFFASTDEPWYEYAKQILRWAGPLYLLLLWPARRDPRIRAPLLFLAAIVAAFSCIRFKQLRYMQAAIPFLALAAAVGWDRLRASGSAGRRIAAAALLLAAALGLERAIALLSDKSQSATAAARAIARLSPAPRTVALEQSWAYGDRLLIGNGPQIRDFPPARPLDPAAVTKAAGPADVLALFTLDTSPPLLDAIAHLGFREDRRFHRDSDKEVILYLRERSRASPAR